MVGDTESLLVKYVKMTTGSMTNSCSGYHSRIVCLFEAHIGLCPKPQWRLNQKVCRVRVGTVSSERFGAHTAAGKIELRQCRFA